MPFQYNKKVNIVFLQLLLKMAWNRHGNCCAGAGLYRAG
ncbi:hypothetical protein CLOLEP_01641 [[Clostridium] leptum DSM 753]|uniref:Uncharacterized protein n=1 Tax=[Clostridium] leptum DSM 753 TaxID=428125 RepID=A7VSV0_9FIRM|nr:hypothetical protein CLOLEP_01641 [[Clostridium] leptum DSM 753]